MIAFDYILANKPHQRFYQFFPAWYANAFTVFSNWHIIHNQDEQPRYEAYLNTLIWLAERINNMLDSVSVKSEQAKANYKMLIRFYRSANSFCKWEELNSYNQFQAITTSLKRIKGIYKL